MRAFAGVVGALAFTVSAAQAAQKAEGSGQYLAASAGYLSAPKLHLNTGALTAGADFGPGESIEFAYGLRWGPTRWEAIGSFERMGAERSVFKGSAIADNVLVGNIDPVISSASDFSFLAGGSYDFATPWRKFGLYVGGAVGTSRASFDLMATTGATVVGDPAYGPARLGVAGANIHLGRGVDAFVEGRYRRLGPFRVYAVDGPVQDAVLEGWRVGAGIRLAL
jgi:opacity protein-like surface antigen